MAYSVVEFQVKDIVNGEEQVTKEVEIVASSWIHGDDKLCWWPGSCSSLSAEKMARRRVEVRDPSKWNQYGIKILHRTDDYLQARQKCRLAEVTSNLDTETENEAVEGRGKRKRKQAQVYSSSENEEDNRRPQKILPRPPAPPKPPSFRRESAQFLPSTHSAPSPALRTPVRPPAPHTPDSPQRTAPSASSSALQTPIRPPAPCTPDSSQLRAPLSDYNVQIQMFKMFKTMENIKEMCAENRRMLQALLTRQTSSSSTEESESLDDLALPASTPEGLEALNEKLESGTVRQKLINQLAVIGGRDLRSTVYNILPKVLLNHLAEQYSCHGRKGKRSLAAHKHVLAVICRAVRKNQRSDTLTDTEILAVVGDWLKHSKCRKDNSTVVERDISANEENNF